MFNRGRYDPAMTTSFTGGCAVVEWHDEANVIFNEAARKCRAGISERRQM